MALCRERPARQRRWSSAAHSAAWRRASVRTGAFLNSRLPRGQKTNALRAASFSLLHGFGKANEKIISKLLRRAVDETLPELRELAADLRLYIIGETGTIALFAELDVDATFRESGDAPITFAGKLVAARRVEIAQPDLAFEARLDGSYLVDRN